MAARRHSLRVFPVMRDSCSRACLSVSPRNTLVSFIARPICTVGSSRASRHRRRSRSAARFTTVPAPRLTSRRAANVRATSMSPIRIASRMPRSSSTSLGSVPPPVSTGRDSSRTDVGRGDSIPSPVASAAKFSPIASFSSAASIPGGVASTQLTSDREFCQSRCQSSVVVPGLRRFLFFDLV